jgi:hypothetical protein
VNSTTVARWEKELDRVRELRLTVLLERDDLPDEWIGRVCCLGASIEDDLDHLKQRDHFVRWALRKSHLDEIAAQLLDQLDDPAEIIEHLSSWLELIERLDAHGPPLDERTPRQLLTISAHGANAPPVEGCLTFTNERGSPL